MATASRGHSGTAGSAVVLLVLACFLFASLDTVSKWIVLQGVDPRFGAWCRFAGQSVFCFVAFRMWTNPSSWKTGHPWLQSLRASLLMAVTTLNFFAFQTVPLVQFVAIIFGAPLIVTLLAGPILSEDVGLRRIVAALVGLCGTLVVIRPGYDGLMIGHAYVVAAMLGNVGYLMMTRALNRTESSQALLFWSAALPFVFLLPTVPLYGAVPDTPMLVAALTAVGVIGATGHFCLILAYRRADASALSPFLYSQIIWAATYGWIVFDDVPDRFTVIGSTIIVGSGLYIGWRERVRGQVRPGGIHAPAGD